MRQMLPGCELLFARCFHRDHEPLLYDHRKAYRADLLRLCAGFNCTLVGLIGVINVQIQKRRHQFANFNATYHNNRIANPQLTWPVSNRSPVALNVSFKNVTSRATSRTISRGVTLCQPSGIVLPIGWFPPDSLFAERKCGERRRPRLLIVCQSH